MESGERRGKAQFVRTSVSLDRQTVEQLQEMLTDLGIKNRSRLIKRLIRKEYVQYVGIRRACGQHPKR